MSLNLDCRVNRSFLRANRKAVVFVSAEVKAGESLHAPTSLHMCLAIDCSQSMAGEKLETAKNAALQIVDQLRPTDYISVVAFADKASVIVLRETATNKDEIRRRIQQIELGSLTDLYAGMELAYNVLTGAFQSSEPGLVKGFKQLLRLEQVLATTSPTSLSGFGINRLILLTDGQPTKGHTDERSFVDLSKKIRDSGISITPIGIGEDYNEDLLIAIATASGGRWYAITDVRGEIPKVFAQELSDMKTVMLVRPVLHVHLMAGAELSNIYRIGLMATEVVDFQRAGSDYIIPLEDVRAGHVLRIVFNIHIPPKPVGVWRIAKITLTGPGTELSKDVVIESTEDQSRWGVETDPYPRALLMLTRATVLARKGVGDATIAVQARDLIETVMKDASAATVVKQDGFMATLRDTVIKAVEQTTMKSKLTEEEKKKLKEETTVMRR
jgi:Ca-activated chloride channel family protein